MWKDNHAFQNHKRYCELFEQNDFVRVNKSHVINLNYLKEVEKMGEITVVMQSGKRIEISRRRKTSFHQHFKAFKKIKHESLDSLGF